MIDTQGELWPMDRFGRATNAGDRSRLTPLARRVARAIADIYKSRFEDDLHSVYLTGPAARGRRGPIEAFGVLRMTASTVGVAWLEDAAESIRARWPAAGRPELALYAWRDAFPDDDAFSLVRFRVGVNSVCLAGRDLSRLVAPQRLSVAAANAWLVQTRERISEAVGAVHLASTPELVRRESRSIGRFLLSAGFALVMPHEGVYTEDLDLQRAFIALNFPEHADAAAAALRFATEATDSPNEVMDLLESYGRWFSGECDRWLDRHNPQRLHALPA